MNKAVYLKPAKKQTNNNKTTHQNPKETNQTNKTYQKTFKKTQQNKAQTHFFKVKMSSNKLCKFNCKWKAGKLCAGIAEVWRFFSTWLWCFLFVPSG